MIAERRREPGEDFFSQLLAAEVDGQRLTDDEIRAMGIVQLIAGHETSANAMAYTLWQLALEPEPLVARFGVGLGAGAASSPP